MKGNYLEIRYYSYTEPLAVSKNDQKIMKEISKNIQDKITLIGKPEKAKWLEGYVKYNTTSKGVGIPEIRAIINDANNDYKLTEKKISKQIELLNDLMSQEYAEDKLAAILYLQLFWKGKKERQTIDLISKWFDNYLITDWNVCDWLCVRIIRTKPKR